VIDGDSKLSYGLDGIIPVLCPLRRKIAWSLDPETVCQCRETIWGFLSDEACCVVIVAQREGLADQELGYWRNNKWIEAESFTICTESK
jgi:hypothetical protein